MTEQQWKEHQRQEWQHLRGYLSCKRLEHEHRSTMSKLSKRTVKANGLGVGQVLKRSWIKPQVHVERIFGNPHFQQFQ